MTVSPRIYTVAGLELRFLSLCTGGRHNELASEISHRRRDRLRPKLARHVAGPFKLSTALAPPLCYALIPPPASLSRAT
jgi:hypothetical protein